mmetsp:Transcript_81448/g.263825  ORF Transcript_81448/g.263825 Transcript_81448/m.263825 type:complete len:245 (-) Transcript_81448:62-796(-)
MPSEFAMLCETRNMRPEEWRSMLEMPIIASKSLLDMDEKELEDHYHRVEERAENTKQDRALIVLERAQEGRLEPRATKLFAKHATAGSICAEQVPEMLEALRFELTNTEVHYLLRKVDATEHFDMIPEAEIDRRQWLTLVGECQMLKESYLHMNPEAFEICYEAMIHNLKLQEEAGLEGTDEWPHMDPTGPGWWTSGGAKAEYSGASKPHVWGMHPEVEEELMRQMQEEEEQARKRKEQQKSME